MKTAMIPTIKKLTAPGLRLFALTAALLSSGQSAQAASDTWNGGSTTSSNWTDTANWGGSTVATGDYLYFGGTAALLNTNDESSFSFAGVTFNSGAGAFNIYGNSFTLTGGITNNSTSLQTINCPIASTAVRTFTTTAGGGDITLGGNYASTGAGITKTGTGTLSLSGDNSFTGGITVNSTGKLQLQANAGNTSSGISRVMPAQNMTLAQLGGGGGATIQLRADSSVASGGIVTFNNGSSQTFGVNSSGNRLGGTFNFDVNNITSGTGQTLQFGAPTATWYLGSGGGTLPTFNVTGGNGYTLQLGDFTVGNNYSMVFNPTTANMIVGALGNGSTGSLTKNGAGTLTLSGANNYTGATTVSGGTLALTGNGTISSTTSKFLIGTVAGTPAAVYQSGASTATTAQPTGGGWQLGSAPGASGYYNLSAGTMTIQNGGEFDPAGSGGGAGTFGQFDLSGGAVNVGVSGNGSSYFLPCRGASGESSVVNLSGGTLAILNGMSDGQYPGYGANWAAGSQTNVTTISGSALFQSLTVSVKLNWANNAGNVGILNLNGGTWQMLGLNNSQNLNVQVNFNGGTVEAGSVANTTFLGNSAAACVYAGGGTVDNYSQAITITQPIMASSGNGISTIPVSGGAGYVMPPQVVISDTTGSNATAYAQISGGAVTGIVVTCPGNNYSSTPTVTLVGGGYTTAATLGTVATAANTSGGLTFTGSSTTTLSGASTYTGNTVISNSTLALATGGSISSTNIIVGSGATFDVSGISFTLGGSQSLSGWGLVSGAVNTTAGSKIYGGTDGTYGTNTFNSSLTLGSGAASYLDVGTVYNGDNDQLVVSGILTLNGNSIHIKAPNRSVNLDNSGNDYVLITAGGINGSFSSTPVWDVAPANSNNFSVVTSGTTVTLHYSTFTPPTGSGFATPTPAFHNQNVLISVTVTNGSGTVDPNTGVVLNAATLDGSLSSVPLVLSDTPNVYTNTITVPTSAVAGDYTLSAVITDSNGQIGTANISLTVNTTEVWNGGGSSTNQNWSNDPNWVVGIAPELSGDSLIFAGTVGTAPNMDNNYSVAGLTFSNNAASFTIGSTTSSTLTLAGGITNNSANAQTLNVPITMSAPQTFNAAAGNITVSGAIDDSDNGYALTKTGNGLLALAAANTYTGPTVVNGGTLSVSGAVAGGDITVAGQVGNAALTVSGSLGGGTNTMAVGTVANAVGAVWQTGGTISLGTGTAFFGHLPGGYGYGRIDAGSTISMTELQLGSWGSSGGNGGNALFEVNGGTVTDNGWLVMARGGTAQTAVLNIFSGSLTYAGGGLVGNWGSGQTSIINVLGGSLTTDSGNHRIGFQNDGTGIINLKGGVTTVSGITGGWGQVNFNGGTLQPSADNTTFLLVKGATVFGGNAIIDNNGYAITIAQPLLAPTGNGINSASVTSGGAGYIAPPIITTTNAAGDTTGIGATAIAQINRLTGAVTNVIVTCPGVNYTATPIFVVSGGGATTPAVITGGALAPNTSGGLTSIGNGTLTLTAANTFNGAVTINGGTLYANKGNSAASGVFTNVSSITVNSGATLESAINSLFGWDASMAKPITVNAGGTLISDTGIDVNVGLITLNGGTLAGDNTTSGWGSWNFGAAAAAGKKLAATDNSTVTAINVVMHNGTVIDVASGKTLTFSGTISDNNDDISAVIKTNTGTLMLSGANTYTGNTTVNGGTLELAQAVLATNSTVSIASGAVLKLDFSTTNQIGALVLNGVSQSPGVYNSTTAAPYLTGTGNLIVPFTGPTGPAYLTNSVSDSNLTLSWPASQNWRLEMQTNSLSTGLGTNWVDVTPGSASSTNITINPAQPTAFYRLVYP